MRRWTDIHDDPDGWVVVEIEVTGPRVLAELLAATGCSTEADARLVEASERPCMCAKCKKIRQRVARKAARRHGRSR